MQTSQLKITVWDAVAPFLRLPQNQLLWYLSSKAKGRFCPGKEAPLDPFSAGHKKLQVEIYLALPDSAGQNGVELLGTQLGCNPPPEPTALQTLLGCLGGQWGLGSA